MSGTNNQNDDWLAGDGVDQSALAHPGGNSDQPLATMLVAEDASAPRVSGEDDWMNMGTQNAHAAPGADPDSGAYPPNGDGSDYLPGTDYPAGSNVGEGDDYPAQDEKPKKSKLKTILLLGGVGLLVFGGMGGAIVYKMSPKSPGGSAMVLPADVPAPAVIPSPKVQPSVPVAAPAQPVPLATPSAIEETRPTVPAVGEVQPSPSQPQGALSTSAAPADVPVPVSGVQPAQSSQYPAPQDRPIDTAAASVNEDLVKLNAKSEVLAKALVMTSEKAGQQQAELDDHGKRIAALEVAVSGLADRLEKLEAAKQPPKQAAKPPVKKAAPPPAKSTSEAKPTAQKPAAPTPRPAPARADAAAKPADVGVSGFSVVATYPSTTQPGMQPQKAWVTNGERLVELQVGASLNGARVTKIEGTTVHTTRGVIRAAK
ncbi:Uncharacterised protein [Achromobacter sp. 2789STDY5608633]|uniref:hypothetical protein n=1 Tax=Pseudomonadota TaxID=1224 RepID=UPI0006C262C4|nr:hypothetical protein [Achromobacter sp. 2789STDY5608633]CUJ50548.1 Uncharacterised protein [Achromobacter sp. 2789STDY5608633]